MAADPSGAGPTLACGAHDCWPRADRAPAPLECEAKHRWPVNLRAAWRRVDVSALVDGVLAELTGRPDPGLFPSGGAHRAVIFIVHCWPASGLLAA